MSNTLPSANCEQSILRAGKSRQQLPSGNQASEVEESKALVEIPFSENNKEVKQDVPIVQDPKAYRTSPRRNTTRKILTPSCRPRVDVHHGKTSHDSREKPENMKDEVVSTPLSAKDPEVSEMRRVRFIQGLFEDNREELEDVDNAGSANQERRSFTSEKSHGDDDNGMASASTTNADVVVSSSTVSRRTEGSSPTGWINESRAPEPSEKSRWIFGKDPVSSMDSPRGRDRRISRKISKRDKTPFNRRPSDANDSDEDGLAASEPAPSPNEHVHMHKENGVSTNRKDAAIQNGKGKVTFAATVQFSDECDVPAEMANPRGRQRERQWKAAKRDQTPFNAKGFSGCSDEDEENWSEMPKVTFAENIQYSDDCDVSVADTSPRGRQRSRQRAAAKRDQTPFNTKRFSVCSADDGENNNSSGEGNAPEKKGSSVRFAESSDAGSSQSENIQRVPNLQKVENLRGRSRTKTGISKRSPTPFIQRQAKLDDSEEYDGELALFSTDMEADSSVSSTISRVTSASVIDALYGNGKAEPSPAKKVFQKGTQMPLSASDWADVRAERADGGDCPDVVDEEFHWKPMAVWAMAHMIGAVWLKYSC